MKYLFLLSIGVILGSHVMAQTKAQNLVVVTMDGMRWHEIFKGLDDSLVNDSRFTRSASDLRSKFDASTVEEKRRKLFPFLWTTVAAKGQLYGNRKYGNLFDNANPYWFSYPGYNEIFTGYPDTAVNSNDKILNPNENVLEFLNKQAGFKGKVAAFSTWDVFPYILNEPRSGIYVNADVDSLKLEAPSLKLLDDMQFLAPRPIGVRPDIITYMIAREYLKAYKPRVLYIAFDETDDFAHGGLYDQYIGSAHSQDGMLADLWNLIQSLPGYKDKTTMIITCDHGRGDKVKSEWQHHGKDIQDAHEIWMAVIGPGIKPLGEIKTPQQHFQKQLAATMAAILGFKFTANHPVASPVSALLDK